MHHGDVSPEIAQGLLALKKRIDAAGGRLRASGFGLQGPAHSFP